MPKQTIFKLADLVKIYSDRVEQLGTHLNGDLNVTPHGNIPKQDLYTSTVRKMAPPRWQETATGLPSIAVPTLLIPLTTESTTSSQLSVRPQKSKEKGRLGCHDDRIEGKILHMP